MPTELIRCFIAVDLPENLKAEISRLQSDLRSVVPEIRWTKASGIHLTLKFLGEIPHDQVEVVRESLNGIGTVTRPFKITVRDLGAFPSQHKPRVLWLGLEQGIDNPLFKLHEWIDLRLTSLGFEREKRRFSPHLTLARIRDPHPVEPLWQYIAEHPFPSHEFRVESVVFMRSRLLPGGAQYRLIENYPLAE